MRRLFNGSWLGSKESSKTSLRFTKRGLPNLLKRRLRDMEQRWKDLKVKVTISQYESHLGRARVQPEEAPASENDLSDSGAKGAMATTPVANDAPLVSTTPEPLTSPPGEDQTCSMEVDDGDDRQPPASPVSHREDELLTGNDVVGVEGEMASLMVSSPGGYDGDDEGHLGGPSH